MTLLQSIIYFGIGLLVYGLIVWMDQHYGDEREDNTFVFSFCFFLWPIVLAMLILSGIVISFGMLCKKLLYHITKR